jgi:hypothetical protein
MLKGYLHSNVHFHCSIIHSGQDIESIQVPINRSLSIDKGNLIYAHNGILFRLSKEGSLSICDIMDEPGGHYAW